ncbi:hypothetical protein E2C01_020898 [Portunus trituberculatus]|uniref:Uncharacterized protein n=1 Tax=Portunus trituberculatus TaxID=210409 RepID=A0A5B7E2U0_PORTR|nr:hypothetical protein [Portunus trituberculatus]
MLRVPDDNSSQVRLHDCHLQPGVRFKASVKPRPCSADGMHYVQLSFTFRHNVPQSTDAKLVSGGEGARPASLMVTGAKREVQVNSAAITSSARNLSGS